MIKKLLLFFIATLFLALTPQKAHAKDSNFDISVNAKYQVQNDGETLVTQNIQIKNKTEYYYTPTYTVTVGFSDVEKIQAFDSSGSIPTTYDDKNPLQKSIKLTFPRRIAGMGSVNNFTLSFTTTDIAKKQGNIWEVSIPGISDPTEFTDYSTTVDVPESFGKASIIKPNVNDKSSNEISFTKEELGRSGAELLYGDAQYFSFTLNYNISNPNLFPVTTEIALPPDTNYQKVLINSFSKQPSDVIYDNDGNWIAKYSLLPQEKETIAVRGIVKIIANPQKSEITKDQIKAYTKPDKYWESDNSEIVNLSKNLQTPKDVYNFVVNTLKYNFDKVSNGNKRLGGVGVLKDPTNAVCLEFTDLFVSLMRAKGIPTRSVEGFAYTDNEKLKPLSLQDDVLHAWPEYYDADQKKWIMVDPTWGNTTKGMDYFDSLDFSHIAFVVKGENSQYPIPAGGYKFQKNSKDVVVNFSAPTDFLPQQNLRISDTFPNFSFPKSAISGAFLIQNLGNTMYPSITAYITTSKQTQKFAISGIPPGGKKTLNLTFGNVPFLTNGYYDIKIQVGEKIYTKKVRISFIPDLKMLLIFGGIICAATIITTITYRTGSLLVQRRKGQGALRRKSKKH